MGKRLIYLFLLLAVVTGCKNKTKRLPFLQQDISGTDTTYRTIPAFKFLNQDSWGNQPHGRFSYGFRFYRGCSLGGCIAANGRY